jgi:integrase
MTSRKLTYSFILKPTKKEGVSSVYLMVRSGSKTLSRTSTGVKVQVKYWANNRVALRHPNAQAINAKLDEVWNDRTADSSDSYSLKYCFLEFFEEWNYQRWTARKVSLPTYEKYCQVIRGIRERLQNAGYDRWPIENFNSRELIELFINLLWVNGKTVGLRSARTVKSYVSIVRACLLDWSRLSGINVIGIPPKSVVCHPSKVRKATVLDFNEFNHFRDFDESTLPISQRVAKKAFLFSYYAGGLRLSDMLSLRVSHFDRNGIKFFVMKSRKSITVQYSFELMLSLSISFDTTFNKAMSLQFRDLKGLVITQSILKVVSSDTYSTQFSKPFNELRKWVMETVSNREHIELPTDWEEAFEVYLAFRNAVTQEFFKAVVKSTDSTRFVFLYLDAESFGSFASETKDMDHAQSKDFQRARTKYNKALERYCTTAGLPRLTSHSARHTLASHLYYDNASVNDIRDVLSHSRIETTENYVQNRLENIRGQQALEAFRGRHPII